MFDIGLMNDCYVLFEYGFFSCLPRLANVLIYLGGKYKKIFGRIIFSELLSCYSYASRRMQSVTAVTGVVPEPSCSFHDICEPPHTVYGEYLMSYILPDENISVSRVSKRRKTEWPA